MSTTTIAGILPCFWKNVGWPTMALAIFDLDNTLIAGDSDYAWGEFLVKQGKVDAQHYAQKNRQFYEEYQAGTLDIFDYLRFALKPLAEIAPDELQVLQKQFVVEVLKTMWLPAAEALIARHRAEGDQLMVISATNRFVVEPICQHLGINCVIATEPEQVAGRYTGNVAGVPSYQEGKVIRLQAWLKNNNANLQGSTFYSDSINDLPLLALVDTAVAVNPDEKLLAEAERRGWQVLNLREG